MASSTAAAADARALTRVAVLPLVLFCLGHFIVDLYSSALGVFQPLLVERFGLSFTQAGFLGSVLVFSSSVMQPFYGILSDRFPSRLFSALAPAMAGIFISSLGWAPAYGTLLAMVWLGGVGIASFHPQAAANAVVGAHSRRGGAMAIFICSGSLGLALGPTFFSLLLGRGGLARSPWAAVPGILVTLLLLAWMPPLGAHRHASSKFDLEPLKAIWKPMTVLYFLVVVRSVVQITFTQFLPLYLHTERGYPLTRASFALSLYLMGGTLGGLAGGNLADRFGGRRVILVSMIGSVPLLALFVFCGGWVSAAGLFLGGLVLLFTIPVNVVMAQQLVPSQAGTVSALTMGFAWGMAGLIFIPLTGWISDHYSMQTAFAALIAFPLIGYFLALKLPK
jgi:FSR family fosmidomycin resistance protein-like MFS transporter